MLYPPRSRKLPPEHQQLRRQVEAENKIIKKSREVVTCDCVGTCVPDTCICIMHGIRCFHDGAVPCACMDESVGCENPLKPDSYNETGIKLHYRRVLNQRRTSSLRTQTGGELASEEGVSNDRAIMGRQRISVAGHAAGSTLHRSTDIIAEEDEDATEEETEEAITARRADPDFDIAAAEFEAMTEARAVAEANAVNNVRAAPAPSRRRTASQREQAAAEPKEPPSQHSVRRSARSPKRRRPLDTAIDGQPSAKQAPSPSSRQHRAK